MPVGDKGLAVQGDLAQHLGDYPHRAVDAPRRVGRRVTFGSAPDGQCREVVTYVSTRPRSGLPKSVAVRRKHICVRGRA
jgi:hypothetical protein